MTKLIVPQWPMPGSVAACSSTRIGGVSLPPYDSLNLGAHCGDNLQHVEENRRRMFAAGGLPSYPVWLEQVHGTDVLTLDGGPYPSKRADASYSRTPGTVCAVMTADCLPVLFCNRAGTEVARRMRDGAAYAKGFWKRRSPVSPIKPKTLWRGWDPPSVRRRFEVGPEVRDAFMAKDENAHQAFRPAGEKYFADIYQLARQRLANVGVEQIFGGDRCTLSEKDDFSLTGATRPPVVWQVSFG